jgi:2-polyprenyl-3-methyl-5-hydroxy-6-metoxy-1,4-benzoquinol methylase
MNPEQYRNLSDIEERHWLYRTKREIVRYWLLKSYPLRTDSVLADCGAGTGLFAQEMSRLCNVIAIDSHEDALRLAEQNIGAERVRRGSCASLPLRDSSVDCVTALDVLEHIEDDRLAVRELARVLKPGGVAIVTVPAMQSLWSDWDMTLHHYRRYRHTSLLKLFDATPFEVTHWNYINVLAFPAVFAARKLRPLFPGAAEGKSNRRLEDKLLPSWLDSSLALAFKALACQNWIRFPAGVGLLAVAKRT